MATMASGRENTGRGKHRTEATEVTEGDQLCGSELVSGHGGFRARNTGKREASHRGHRGHGGGSALWLKVGQ